MITLEEAELALSFRRQLNEKIETFNQKLKESEQQERELQILVTKTEAAKVKFEKQAAEYREMLQNLRKQIELERGQLRAEESARNKYLLRSIRISKTLECLPVQVFAHKEKKTEDV